VYGVEGINRLQSHRGPDHAVVVDAGPGVLANTRLAIQDPRPEGNQPFRSADGRYVCVFNGEIYNYRELIAEHRLQLPNECDGAVIPELWARFGARCLESFRGMYAIAVADRTAGTVTLARDPFGIKPLHTRRMGDVTWFASEIRPLLTLGPAAVSPEAVACFLHLGAVPVDRSPFADIDVVPPNTVRTYAADGSVSDGTIVAGSHPLAGDGGVTTDAGAAFLESVALHLRADVPSVLLLSAGVDSAAIACAGRRLGITLHCMTVTGAGADDESVGAARTAATFGHTFEVVAPVIDEHAICRYFTAMQRPSIDGLNTFVVCSAVQAAGYRVALSGLGGDEAFSGYSQYRALPALGALRSADRVPGVSTLAAAAVGRFVRSSAGPKLRRLVAPGGPRSAWDLNLLQREVLPADEVRMLTGSGPVTAEPRGDTGSYRSLVEAELVHYLQPMLLQDADAYSMCSSVELRVPFVDRTVLAAATSANSLTRVPKGKRLLVEGMDDDHLRTLLRRRKTGFTVPMADWLERGPLRPYRLAVREPDAPVWDHVDREQGLRVLDASHTTWSRPYALIALNAWLLSLSA